MKLIINLFFIFLFFIFLPKGHSESDFASILASSNFEEEDCAFTIGNGQIDCTEYLPNGNLRVVVNNNNILTEYEIDENGATVASQELGLAVESTLEIENNVIVKRDASGNIIFQQALNATLVDQYFSFEKVIEFDGGYIMAAYENESIDWNFDPGLTLVKTDFNTTVLNTFQIASEGQSQYTFVHGLVEIENNRFAIIVNQQPEQYFPETNFYLFDASFDLKFEKKINNFNQGSSVFPNANLRQTACGYWYYRTVNGSENCNFSCVISKTNTYFNFENDEIINYKSNGTAIGSIAGDVTFSIPTTYISNYGSSSTYNDSGILKAYYRSTIPGSPSYQLVHLDSNGDTLWQNTPDEIFTWVEFVKIGTNYFLLDGELQEPSTSDITLQQVSDPCTSINNTCTNEIAGFTLLGEFEESKYFISNDASQPVDAQLVAQQNNGYLAVINSQEENDFIQQNISEMTYIGLNDVDSEGNLVWENGDPLIYNNINPCSFCNENSDEQDYVIMAPWDGAWSFSSVWNSRKYIVEIPCDSPSGEFEITYDCPTEFPQTGIWEVPVTLTNNTANPSNPFFLSLYLEGNGTGPNPQTTFTTVTAPILQVGESTIIILEANLPSIEYYLPNRKTFPSFYIGEFTYGDFYISRSATVPQPTVPFDFYCKKYTTDLAVAIQNPVPTFTSNNEVIYTVEVTNNGAEDAYNIQTQLLKSIATSYPIGGTVDYSADINNMSAGSWQRLSGGNYVWYLSKLEVGESATVEVIYHLDDPLEFGANLPDDFTVNVSTTSGHLIDADESNNTFTFVFEKENAGGGDCPNTIAGFTLLGKFEGNKYFISNDVSQPVDAQLVAQQNNGYLAVVNSQQENDFLQQNISEMTYIGLNDVDIEGNLVWENGDPLNYNNINPCSFCNGNSDELDYVIMAPWDGAWSFSSLWNSRKYIVEIPCDSDSMPGDFCGYLNSYSISSTENFRNYSLEETPTGLVLQTATREDMGGNNNSFFETTNINNDGQATGASSLTLPVDNKSKFGNFGYRLEEIMPTQFQIAAVNSSNGNIWESIVTLNVSDNNIDELISIEIKEMEDHLVVAGSYHFGGVTTPTWRSFLIKLDLDGNEIWQKVFDVVTYYPRLLVHDVAASGGYYLDLDDVSDGINYLVKTDEFGNPIWTEVVTIILFAEEIAFGGESPDGSGVILGVHSQNTNNGEIIKFNINSGIRIWTKNLSLLLPGGQGTVAQGINGIIATSDGGAVFMANFLSYSLMTQIYIYGRLDSDGNEIWHYKIPDELRDHQATLETSDGGLVFSKYNEENNTVNIFKTNSNGLFDPICNVDIFSDLSLSNLRGWQGGPLTNGDSETIEFKIHNNALADAENYVVKAYLSTDNLLSANDILVTAFGYSSTSFGVHEVSEAFQIPFVPEAEYRLLLEVDGNYTIAETDEDNNVLPYSQKRLITGGPLLELPDLRPGFLDIGGNFGLETPPGDYEYTFDLSNFGNIPSNGGKAKMYLSEDSNWSSDDILIGEKLVGNVPVGGSTLIDVAINVTITNDISEGLYRLILVIDAEDEILEFDELNNETTNGITVISNTNCPDDLPGFDFLGEFENSKYFISQDATQPIEAQNIAINNGGYLATIKSFSENDFIFSQIDEMVYIGLNDFDMEDNYEWFNGEPVSYVNFDICSFCNDNSAEMDFVVMHNWNGKWSWSNIWNSRKYIVEIPCSSTLINPNIDNSIIAQVPNQIDFGKLMIEKIYPNPAKDFIFATIHSPIEQEVELQIFDARGLIVRQITMLLQEGENTTEVSIGDLPGGFYSVFVSKEQSKSSMVRFVKIL